MTLTAAWYRNAGTMSELVMASDSRLSGGQRWDGCPKILALPRSDCLVSFAGDTQAAYPMMLQLSNTIAFYPPSRERRLDINHLRGHTLRLFNQMRGLITGLPVGQEQPDDPQALFLLGGYLWRFHAFYVWKLEFSGGEFFYRRVIRGQQTRRSWSVHFAGDTDAVDHANERLGRLLSERSVTPQVGLDMEPFEVLRDIIREETFPSVGGAPQLAKVYRHLNMRFFALPWDGHLSVAGRPLLPYERAFVPEIDVDHPADQPRAESAAALAGEEARMADEEDLSDLDDDVLDS
jgi:hypothetical protein